MPGKTRDCEIEEEFEFYIQLHSAGYTSSDAHRSASFLTAVIRPAAEGGLRNSSRVFKQHLNKNPILSAWRKRPAEA